MSIDHSKHERILLSAEGYLITDISVYFNLHFKEGLYPLGDQVPNLMMQVHIELTKIMEIIL